jgi:DNA (cytosine-5)-methyltransferase 1
MMYTNFKFDRNKPIKLFEAFAGYGSQYMALKRLGVNVDVVGYSEIDKFAIQVYEALHGKHKNYGGIGSFDRLPPNIDICTWSFPCQDISLAGKQKGMEDGTRSNYGYVFLDTVKNTPKEERPKVLLMENVKALFTERFRDDWREIQLRLERMGYTNYADILNAKDYGVAQNRERVFIVSILGEYNYTFPKPIPLTKRLKDYLEDEVDEKYYLSDKTIENTFLNYKGMIQTIKTSADDIGVVVGTYQYAKSDNFMKGKDRLQLGKETSDAIQTTPKEGIVYSNLRIRKLTPREALRLMDVSESDIDIITNTVSNAQAYKLAGNSIVVSVLEAIFRNLF